ncbi:MAG: ABC transporter permease, partial [Planctomycetota bacterium]
KKLRTILTTSGVMIGIGALVSMFSFGQGVQKNITHRFKELDLLNYIAVYPPSEESLFPQPSEKADANQPVPALNDEFIDQLTQLEGVVLAFPEIRFPALVRFHDKQRFCFIQVFSAPVCRSGLLKIREGDYYAAGDANSLIISDSLLRRMHVRDPKTAIGEVVEVSTLKLDSQLFNPANIASVMQGDKLPFSQESHAFNIVAVAERMGFGGPMPMRSDVYIAPAASNKMKKVLMTNIRDLFQSPQQAGGYSAVSVKVSSIRYIDSVKALMEEKGLRTFALVDQLGKIKTGFIFMDMFLFALGMIAITVASLGIINTMVMSILERYREIGIMKAVGASDRDVKKIFFFESGVIGFLGGVFGLVLGWVVSMLINQVANYFLAKHAVPYVDYFSFPWWLCLGAVIFPILISLVAAIYPASRAARVDPVVALRHD